MCRPRLCDTSCSKHSSNVRLNKWPLHRGHLFDTTIFIIFEYIMNAHLESLTSIITGLDFDAAGIKDCAGQLAQFSQGIADPAAKQAWAEVAKQFDVVAANMLQRKSDLKDALLGLQQQDVAQQALQREIDAAPVVSVVWEGFDGDRQKGGLEPRSPIELENFIGKRMKLIEDKG